MISIKENRVLILEDNGIWVKYPKKVGFMHRDCYEDYACKKNLLDFSISNIVKKTHCVAISNLDDKTILGYFPNELTEEQLYQLDLLSTLSLDDVQYMEAKKYNQDKDEFVLDSNVAERFSTELIQSYYQPKNKKEQKSK